MQNHHVEKRLPALKRVEEDGASAQVWSHKTYRSKADARLGSSKMDEDIQTNTFDWDVEKNNLDENTHNVSMFTNI